MARYIHTVVNYSPGSALPDPVVPVQSGNWKLIQVSFAKALQREFAMSTLVYTWESPN